MNYAHLHPALVLNGLGIRCTDDTFANLPDLWKASGATRFYGPSEWIRMELAVAGRPPLRHRQPKLNH